MLSLRITSELHMCCLIGKGGASCFSSNAEAPPEALIGVWQGTRDVGNAFVHLRVWPDGVIDFESGDLAVHRVPMCGWEDGTITGSPCIGQSYSFQINLIDDSTVKLDDVQLRRVGSMDLTSAFDRDEAQMKFLLEHYNKVLLVEAFMEKYEPYLIKGVAKKQCCTSCQGCCMPTQALKEKHSSSRMPSFSKEMMITREAFGVMLDDADILVDNTRQLANQHGIKKTTEISFKVAAGRQVQVVRDMLMKTFAEEAGVRLVNGMLPRPYFLSAILTMKDASNLEDRHERGIGNLLNYYFKSMLVDVIIKKYKKECKLTKSGDPLITQRAVAKLLDDADTFVSDNEESCSRFGIKRSNTISWKISLGTSLGLVKGEIWKKFAEASGEALVDGGLTRDAFFASLLNM